MSKTKDYPTGWGSKLVRVDLNPKTYAISVFGPGSAWVGSVGSPNDGPDQSRQEQAREDAVDMAIANATEVLGQLNMTLEQWEEGHREHQRKTSGPFFALATDPDHTLFMLKKALLLSRTATHASDHGTMENAIFELNDLLESIFPQYEDDT